MDDHCRKCGVSKQQILVRDKRLVELVKRAAPFVNAVAALAAGEDKGDPGPALGWIADAAEELRMTTDALSRGER